MNGLYGESSFSPYFSGRAVVFGGFPQGAPLASIVMTSLMSEIGHSLRAAEPTLSETEADLLYLAHVGFLVERTRAKKRGASILVRLRVPPSIGQRIEPGLLRLQYATPAIFSERLELLPPAYRAGPQRDGVPALLSNLMKTWQDDPVGRGRDPSLDLLHRTARRRDGNPFMPLVANLGIDRRAARAALFYVDRQLSQPDRLAGSGPPSFDVLAHREDLTSVQVEARASHSGYVRLSYSFDPDLEISLDGSRVPAVADALAGGVVVAFPAGHHTVSIQGAAGTMRILLFANSAIFATALGGWLIVSRARVTNPTSTSAHSTRSDFGPAQP